MNKTLVFCAKCEHAPPMPPGYAIEKFMCMHDSCCEIKNTPIKPRTVFKCKCIEKNKNNGCKDYKEKVKPPTVEYIEGNNKSFFDIFIKPGIFLVIVFLIIFTCAYFIGGN